MEYVVVLVTEGKNENVDFATVVTLGSYAEAEEFCKANNTGAKKYWKKAEIVSDGEQIELCNPTLNEK
jgi:hypothetical protein